MTILVLSTRDIRRGTMTRPVFLIRELCKQFDLIVFNVRTPWKQIPMEEMEWVGEKLPLTVFEDLSRFQGGGLIGYEILNAVPNSNALGSLIRDYDIQLVINFSNITLANLKGFWGKRIPMITDFYDWLPDMIRSKYFSDSNLLLKWFVERFVYLLMRRVFSKSQLITSSSASLRDLVSTITKNPVHLVSNGVDTKLFHPITQSEINRVRQELNVDCDVLAGTVMTVWFPGVLDNAVQAIKRLQKQQVDARLLVIGTGPLLNYYRDRVQKLSIDEAVRFLGLQPYQEVARILGATDVCLMPQGENSVYYQTARHFKLLEFLALGKPVISPQMIEIRRMFPTDTSPVFFASSAEEITEVILNIYHNPKEVGRLGLQGRELMVSQFDWKAISKEFAAKIQSFLH